MDYFDVEFVAFNIKKHTSEHTSSENHAKAQKKKTVLKRFSNVHTCQQCGYFLNFVK